MKIDFDLLVKDGNAQLKPEIGIKRLLLVSDLEEKATEGDAIKALTNVILS